MSEAEFKAFSKITRLHRECIATEKIDGTNGLVYVGEDGVVRAGSRNRWITPEADNFGFARWVVEHADELRALGFGYHYGEWWGAGIQRRYGLAEKRWSLFNVSRWGDVGSETMPACCHVVPVLGSGARVNDVVDEAIALLRANGSQAAPGFMQPEGVVVFHSPSRVLFKATMLGDEKGKGE
jgi:hypothetical protein